MSIYDVYTFRAWLLTIDIFFTSKPSRFNTHSCLAKSFCAFLCANAWRALITYFFMRAEERKQLNKRSNNDFWELGWKIDGYGEDSSAKARAIVLGFYRARTTVTFRTIVLNDFLPFKALKNRISCEKGILILSNFSYRYFYTVSAIIVITSFFYTLY